MIELITDSTSDISQEEAAQLGIRVLPLPVYFEDQAFQDGIDISNDEFYARLRQAETLPTTSQINPDTFLTVFQEVLDRGNQAVGIFLSSELSGTFQSALIAKNMLDSKDIFVIDSRHVAISLGLLVTEAVRARDEGKTADELVCEISALRDKLRLYAVVDTLKYLKMGGRISAATAAVGGVLGITPIIAVQNGKVESVGKTRGRKAGLRWICDRVTEEDPDLSRPMGFVHTDCPEALEAIEAAFADTAAQASTVYRKEVGAVVGTHAGPGAAGVAFFVK